MHPVFSRNISSAPISRYKYDITTSWLRERICVLCPEGARICAKGWIWFDTVAEGPLVSTSETWKLGFPHSLWHRAMGMSIIRELSASTLIGAFENAGSRDYFVSHIYLLRRKLLISNIFRYEILRRHNEYRSDVQKGKNGMPPTQVRNS